MAKRSSSTAQTTAEPRRGPRRGRGFWLLTVLVLIVTYVFANFVDVWLASRRSDDVTASAAIVLGAAQYNGEPSPALRGRLDRAAELYLTDTVEFVVVTGGGRAGDATTEAKASYDYLRSVAGLPDERLFLEVDGTSTYEELAASARFLTREGLTDVIVVSDPYHVRRAELIAEEVGLDADVRPTDSAAPFSSLVRESVAVSMGRAITFRRLERVTCFIRGCPD